MGFLRPKTPPPPPPPTPMPSLPPATGGDLDKEKKKKIKDELKKMSAGYTQTIMTSKQGDTTEADTFTKTLLGQ